jgi:hypothetical protein
MYNGHNKMYTVNTQKNEEKDLQSKRRVAKNVGDCCSITRSQAA